MHFDAFMKKVVDQARLASMGDAVAATRATLETLGERLSEGAAGGLAGQLPREVGIHLLHARYDNNFDLEEFYRRMEAKAPDGVDRPQAVHQAKCVMAVVEEAVGRDEMQKIQRDLGEAYADLFAQTHAAPGR